MQLSSFTKTPKAPTGLAAVRRSTAILNSPSPAPDPRAPALQHRKLLPLPPAPCPCPCAQGPLSHLIGIPSAPKVLSRTQHPARAPIAHRTSRSPIALSLAAASSAAGSCTLLHRYSTTPGAQQGGEGVAGQARCPLALRLEPRAPAARWRERRCRFSCCCCCCCFWVEEPSVLSIEVVVRVAVAGAVAVECGGTGAAELWVPAGVPVGPAEAAACGRVRDTGGWGGGRLTCPADGKHREPA